MPRPTNAGSPPTWSTIQPKFWPKKPVMNISGRKIVAIVVEAVRHGRQVDVHQAREQIAGGVDRVGQADQVVVDVAEETLRLRVRAGQVGDPVRNRGDHVALRHDHLAQADKLALRVEDAPHLLLPGLREHTLLDRVHEVVEM